MLKWFKKALVLTILVVLPAFFLLEFGLSVLPFFVGDPLKSFILEAKRVPYSNTRTYGGFKGGTRILIPQIVDSDLLILGDSIPFGTYVKTADIFSTHLSQALSLKTVNLSVGAMSPPEYNQMLQVGLRYHPQLIVYCIFANDFDVTTHGNPRPDSTLYLSSLDVYETSAQFVKQFTNLSLGYQLFKFFKQPAAKFHTVLWNDAHRSFVFAPKAYWDSMIDWNSPNVQQAAAVNARYVLEARSIVEKHQSRFLTVLFPSKEMVFGPLAANVSQPIYSDAHHLTYRKFMGGLKTNGIQSLDLTEPLRQESRSGKKLFHTIDGHYNEEGHEVIAALLREPIAQAMAAP